jgi:hypothetical protein
MIIDQQIPVLIMMGQVIAEEHYVPATFAGGQGPGTGRIPIERERDPSRNDGVLETSSQGEVDVGNPHLLP